MNGKVVNAKVGVVKTKVRMLGRLGLVAVMAIALVLLWSDKGLVPLGNRASAQLSPAQIPAPLPPDPIPNDLRQLLIPGNVNLTADLAAIVLPYPTLHDLPASSYTPRQENAIPDPSNYGYRFLTDARGNPVDNAPIVVVHETVGSASSAINTFRTPHRNGADQRTYHALIRRNGSVVYLLPPEYRAFGAGNSVFAGPNGSESVVTNPLFPASVNNFAYHISLESPSDGRGNGAQHSGYTDAQYRSLAWLTARTGVPEARLTSHKAVDRSGSRRDPRSFDQDRFLTLLRDYPPA